MDALEPERSLLEGYEDVPFFLNQWKLKRSLALFFHDIFHNTVIVLHCMRINLMIKAVKVML